MGEYRRIQGTLLKSLLVFFGKCASQARLPRCETVPPKGDRNLSLQPQTRRLETNND